MPNQPWPHVWSFLRPIILTGFETEIWNRFKTAFSLANFLFKNIPGVSVFLFFWFSWVWQVAGKEGKIGCCGALGTQTSVCALKSSHKYFIYPSCIFSPCFFLLFSKFGVFFVLRFFVLFFAVCLRCWLGRFWAFLIVFPPAARVVWAS